AVRTPISRGPPSAAQSATTSMTRVLATLLFPLRSAPLWCLQAGILQLPTQLIILGDRCQVSAKAQDVKRVRIGAHAHGRLALLDGVKRRPGHAGPVGYQLHRETAPQPR